MKSDTPRTDAEENHQIWADPLMKVVPAEFARTLERESNRGKLAQSLLSQMLNVALCADETGYVVDVGFVDIDALHDKVRAFLGEG